MARNPKISLPDGGEIRIQNEDGSEARLFLPEYGMDDFVVGVPTDISKGIDDPSDPSEDAIDALNELFHDQHATCRFCGNLRHFDELRSYGFAGTICLDCWENCPECGNCDEWERITSRSTRKPNKKKCTNCGEKLITAPATG